MLRPRLALSPCRQTYRVQLFDDELGTARDIEFEAADGLHAIRIVGAQAPRRRAELWHEGQMLCTLRRSTDGFREIGPRRPDGARQPRR